MCIYLSAGLSMLKVVDIETIEKKKLTHLVYFNQENKSSESSVYHFILSFVTVNFVVQWINDQRNSLFKVSSNALLRAYLKIIKFVHDI